METRVDSNKKKDETFVTVATNAFEANVSESLKFVVNPVPTHGHVSLTKITNGIVKSFLASRARERERERERKNVYPLTVAVDSSANDDGY